MNFHHKAKKVAIVGASGSGKTTYYLNYIRRYKAKWKFVFDPDREVATKLKLQAVTSLEGIKRAVKAQYPIVYDPIDMFPGYYAEALSFFCRLVYEVSKQLQGPKLLAVDEIQKWTRTGIGGVPRSLVEIMDAGRREEIDFVCVCNKGLNKLSDEIRGQLTEIVAFCTTDKTPLKWIEESGFDPEQIKKLKVGQYVLKRQ